MREKVISVMMIVGLIGLVLSMTGCTTTNEPDQSDESNVTPEETVRDHLILAIGGEPDDGFDPATGWGRSGSPLFQSTLLKRDATFEIENDLAESYEISKDGLTWTVYIRDDVVFSDGEPLTAEDVVFTFKTATESGSVVDLNHLEEVKEIDPFTIQFTLKEPQSTFIHSLIVTGIIPKHAYSEGVP